ncbi:MAG: exosortase-associated EpsI family protein [Phycisphaerae bacterium]|nr:exosortase-associated EpsI family protein [Phycisphaerae bacterium]
MDLAFQKAEKGFSSPVRERNHSVLTGKGLIFWLGTALLVINLGLLYRKHASFIHGVVEKPAVLPIALKFLPQKTQTWNSRDIELSAEVRQAADCDDYVNRLYADEASGEYANLYIAYSSRPRTMVGHRPDTCYTANGWMNLGTKKTEFKTANGVGVPCLIHRFKKSFPREDEILVLNFYVLNGQIVNEESGFSGLGWRTPNIKGDPAFYVAQVQISGTMENSVLRLAHDITDSIIEILPDKNGQVGMAELNAYSESSNY